MNIISALLGALLGGVIVGALSYVLLVRSLRSEVRYELSQENRSHRELIAEIERSRCEQRVRDLREDLHYLGVINKRQIEDVKDWRRRKSGGKP